MKINSKKPRICIALPGINYVSSSPYVLSTLPIVSYLEQDFEITLVFRKVLEQNLKSNYLTILPQDNVSETNLNPYFYPGLVSGYKYLGALDKFAKKYAQQFDLIIEKEWRMLGAFSRAFQPYNVPRVIISEAEFISNITSGALWQGNPVKKVLSFIFERGLPNLRRTWIKKADSIITETEQMKRFLLHNNYVNRDTPIYPIQNGIDNRIFYPRDRHICREKLGISQNTFVLTYVGSLNRFIQEPVPVIQALGQTKPKDVVLHIVGDGIKRKELETIAQNFDSPVVFHGKLPQDKAALYIGAANLCIAPYDKTRFPENKFTSSSLKVIEYLGCARPVISIPCERMEHLLDAGKYGFLVDNKVESYQSFFQNLPNKNDVLAMEDTLIRDLDSSTLKDRGIVLTWEDIAQMYKTAIKDTLDSDRGDQLKPGQSGIGNRE